MRILYNFGIWFYYHLVGLVGLFNEKAKKFHSGRRGLLNVIEEQVKDSSGIVWFHCSSVGEFEQARPLIEWYKKQDKGYKILVTFFSPSGYELRKNYSLADWVFYLPVDTRSNVVKFLDAVRPVKAIFIKYEFWYNYLTELHKRGVETYLVSAIFRDTQPFFKWYGGFFKSMLRSFTAMFVQDEKSVRLLATIGFEKGVYLAGDTRFDRVYEVTQNSRHFPIIEQFTSGSPVLVAGSTWGPDEKIIAKVLKNFKKIKLVIAPHEIGAGRISEVEEIFKDFRCVRFSWFDEKSNHTLEEVQNKIDSSNVLIIDCIGILSSIYRYGELAYVGGGFGVGIHNILEAATYGMPVLFGPNYHKFKEAKDLIKLGGACSFLDEKGFYSHIDNFVTRPDILKVRGEICSSYVQSNLGATKRVVEVIEGV